MAPERAAQDVIDQRRLDKQRARDEDDRALAAGEKSAAQLNKENGHFARLKAVVNYDGARRRY